MIKHCYIGNKNFYNCSLSFTNALIIIIIITTTTTTTNNNDNNDDDDDTIRKKNNEQVDPTLPHSSSGSHHGSGQSNNSSSADSGALTVSSASMGPTAHQRRQANALMQSTETMMKFGFMSMSMTYFSRYAKRASKVLNTSYITCVRVCRSKNEWTKQRMIAPTSFLWFCDFDSFFSFVLVVFCAFCRTFEKEFQSERIYQVFIL